MTKIKSISVSKEGEKIYEDLNKIRPNTISFSSMLVLASREYVKNHMITDTRITDFESEDSRMLPSVYADPHYWTDTITTMDIKDLKLLQGKLKQIQNLIKFQQGKIL
jgi:hypothetical protein